MPSPIDLLVPLLLRRCTQLAYPQAIYESLCRETWTFRGEITLQSIKSNSSKVNVVILELTPPLLQARAPIRAYTDRIS